MLDKRCLNLIFVRDNRLAGRLVRFFDRSYWSHVGVVDGKYVIHASGSLGGVVVTKLDQFIAKYDEHEFRHIKGDLNVIKKHIGKPYDLAGIKGFVLPWVQHKVDEIFCTEIVALACNNPTVRKQAHLVGIGELNRWSEPGLCQK